MTITAQLLDFAAGEAGESPPDDKTAVAMFTAHRLDSTLHHLAHATEQMQAARASSGDVRAWHARHLCRHLQRSLDAGHELTAAIRAHYPAEAAELEQVKQAVGLARSLTPAIRAATAAHLLETTLHEETHGVRHALEMTKPGPGPVWEFNADHCEKHLGGAVEHASKLAHHFADNYPAVARWLGELGEITSGGEDGEGQQHARYSKRKASLAAISAQALDLASEEQNLSVTVTGPPDQLGSFVQLCKTIQYLCAAGSSRTVMLDVDGDGSGHLRFDFGDLDHSGVEIPEITGDHRVRVAGIGLANPVTISAQIDLAEVDVRPFQRVVQTRLGPRTEVVRGHTENRQGWIPQPKWQAGQQEWEAKGEAAWKNAAAAREAAEPQAAATGTAAVPWDTSGDVMRYHGSLGVDRADMPQVSGTLADGRYAPSSEMMPKFLDHLKSRGVDVTHERVPARTLKPTQTTGDMRAVRGIADSLASGDLKDTKPVLVSSDNRVVDGHHQWAAHVLGASEGKRTGSAPGEPVIRADMPADKLMAEARQFAKDQGIQNRKTGVAANPKYARPSISEQSAAKDTLEKYQNPDGTFTPERTALHQSVINDILAGHQPQEHPVATFFGGGPASGKSTALEATAPDAAVIDPDAIKARLPEYQQMLDAKDPQAAQYVHEESSLLAKRAMAEAQKRRINYVLDGTGDSSVDKLAAKVNGARRAGYMTDGKYVTVDTNTAVQRAMDRAKATGRMVPESVIRETHKAVSDTYPKAMKMGLFDRTELWDTSAAHPALVASREPGGQFTVHDPQAWQRFTAKAYEAATPAEREQQAAQAQARAGTQAVSEGQATIRARNQGRAA